jgi:hypothetical protein
MPEVNLGGWEVAYVFRYGDINASVAADLNKQKLFPSKISLSETSSSGKTVNITGTAQPWELISGGALDSASVQIAITDCDIVGGPTDHLGGAVTIKLKMKLAVSPAGVVSIDPSTIVIASIDFVFLTKLGLIELVGAKSAFTNWVKGLGVSLFAAELTRVDTAAVPDKSAWQWLMPQVAQVALQENVAEQPSEHRLAVVGMLTTARAPGSPVLANIEIPTGAKVGYFIEQSNFLKQLILPGLKLLFDGATDADFDASSGHAILQRNPLKYDKFDVGDGNIVPAAVPKFAVTISGSELRLKMTVEFPYQGVNASSTFEAYMEFVLDSNGVITTNNTYIGIPETKVDAGPTLATASWLLPLIVGVIAAVCAGVGSAVKAAGRPAVNQANPNQVALGPINMPGQPASAANAANAAAGVGANLQGLARVNNFVETAPTWALVTGAVAGSLIVGGVIGGSIVLAITAIQSGTATQMAADLDKFMLNALRPVQLPSSISSTMKIQSVALNGALVIGVA